MSLIWAIGFNENDTSNVRDYSESNKDATTVANLILAADASEPGGRYGIGDGSSTDVEVTNGRGISYGDDFGIFVQFNVQVDQDGFIYIRPNHSRIRYDAATNSIIAEIWDTGAGNWTTSSTTQAVSLNTWYKAALTYSDANAAKLYLNTAVAPDTDASVINVLNTGDVTLFNDSAGGNFFDGWIRELLIFDTEPSQSEVHNLMAHSQGVTINITGHSLNVGDLIQTFTDNIVQVCVFLSFTDLVRVRLISGVLAGGEQWYQVGHRWDTTRQGYTIAEGTNDATRSYNEISKFSDVGTANKMILDNNPTGFFRRTLTKEEDYTLVAQDLRVVFDTSASALIATLPASPIDNEEHTVTRSGGNSLTVDGNGNNINGSTTGALTADNESWHLYYDGVQDNEWKLM